MDLQSWPFLTKQDKSKIFHNFWVMKQILKYKKKIVKYIEERMYRRIRKEEM